MSVSITYDDRRLSELYDDLRDIHRKRVLVNAYRKAQRHVLRSVRTVISEEMPGHSRQLVKCAWGRVYTRNRQKLGFRVSVGESGKKGLYRQTNGNKIPLLRWLETGTGARKTSRGLSRGSLSAHNFIRKGWQRAGGAERVNVIIREGMREEVVKMNEKYGR